MHLSSKNNSSVSISEFQPTTLGTGSGFFKYSLVLLFISMENFKLFYFSVNHHNIMSYWQYYIAQIVSGENILSKFNHKVNRVIWKLNKCQQIIWGFKKYRICVEKIYKYTSFHYKPGTFQELLLTTNHFYKSLILYIKGDRKKHFRIITGTRQLKVIPIHSVGSIYSALLQCHFAVQ